MFRRTAVLASSVLALAVIVPSLADAAANLVQNPSLETGVPATFTADVTTTTNPDGPDNWSPIWFFNDPSIAANSTFTFTYPVDGSGGAGTKAAEVTAANYSNGAAEWAPNAVAVTPGTLYTISDKYWATVDTAIDVAYKVAAADSIANECSPSSDPAFVNCFEVLAHAVPATTDAAATDKSFHTYIATVTPPPGAVSMTVQHMLTASGSLAVDDFSITEGADATQAYPQGIVSLSFDDGYLDHYTNAFQQVLKPAGMHGTFYIIANPTLNASQFPGTLDTAQMLEMQAAGEDMSAHTVDHCDLVALDKDPSSATDGGASSGTPGAPGIGCPAFGLKAATTSTAEIENSRIELAGAGVTPDESLAYPYGSYSKSVEAQVAAAGFKGARTTDQGFNIKGTDPYALLTQDISNTTSLAQIQSWIDTALANKVWLIFVFHQIEPSNPNNDSLTSLTSTLQGTVNYLAQKQACVMTVGGVLDGQACGSSGTNTGTTTGTGTGTTTATTTVDTTAPHLTITSPAAGATITTATSTVTGSSDDTASISIALDGKTYTATPAGGTWSVAIPDADALADGTYTINASSTDTAGNTGTASSTFIVSIPAATGTSTATSTATSTNATPTPTPVSTGGGGGNAPAPVSTGGGGGGNGPIVGSMGPAITNAVFTFGSLAQGSSTGSVLGTSTSAFKFTKPLSWGMHSTDVTELQKRLIAEGFLVLDAPTLYFGPMTFHAVEAYQGKHGIEQVGIVGPKTRAALNSY